jgi:hypothetical protein
MAIDQNEDLEIPGQVRRILASKRFANAPKAKFLLNYIVEKALAGLEGDLKEILIAQALYGKGPAFDPGTDRIVSQAAGDLRKGLIEYYADEGQRDHCVIAIPIGSFVPEFRTRSEPAPTAARPAPSADAGKAGAKRAWALKASVAAAVVILVGGVVRATLRLHGASHESCRRRDGGSGRGRHRKGLGAKAQQLPDRGACGSARAAVGPGPNCVARVDAERALRAG